MLHTLGLVVLGAFLGAMTVCALVPLAINAATRKMLRGR